MTQQLITTPTAPGYVVAYGHQKAPVYAYCEAAARRKGNKLFKVPTSKQHLVSALLAQQAYKEDIQFMEYVEHYYGEY